MHDAIVRLARNGVFTVFPLPRPGVLPDGITAGPDGNLWFAEFYGDAVGRITPQGVITEFYVPPRPHPWAGDLPNSQPHAIVAGPDGNLWFPDLGGNKIGRITPSGAITEYPIPFKAFPYGVATGPDGAIWFTSGSTIGRTSLSGHMMGFNLPGENHAAKDIVAGADGALWFLEPNPGLGPAQNLLGRITVDGQITEFPLPRGPCGAEGMCGPDDLTEGPDGAIWFSEPWRNALGRIDAQGHMSEYGTQPLSTAQCSPEALALGPDDAFWFTCGKDIGHFGL